MSPSGTIVIAASDLIPALRVRAGLPDDALAFPDSEPLEALEAIGEHRPSVVLLERFFAATPRGAALINRLREDPTFASSEIRVMSHDSDYSRVVRRPTTPVSSPATSPPADGDVPALDFRGTRRAPRVAMREGVQAVVDGSTVALVDLSVVGAQVISDTVLRPNRKVRVTLSHGSDAIRIGGTIAWASFEMSHATGSPQYRAGVEFVEAEADAVEAFCQAHRA